MLILAAAGLQQLFDAYGSVQPSRRRQLAVAGITLLLVLVAPLASFYQQGLASSYLAYTEHPTQRETLELLGKAVEKHVPEGERIYVLAYDVGVYLYARRRPASRFTYPRSVEQMAEILDDLEAGKAHTILIPHRSSSEFDRWCDDSCRARTDTLLADYEQTASLDRYTVWVRSAQPATPQITNRSE